MFRYIHLSVGLRLRKISWNGGTTLGSNSECVSHDILSDVGVFTKGFSGFRLCLFKSWVIGMFVVMVKRCCKCVSLFLYCYACVDAITCRMGG